MGLGKGREVLAMLHSIAKPIDIDPEEISCANTDLGADHVTL
jgi:hypothetical protein